MLVKLPPQGYSREYNKKEQCQNSSQKNHLEIRAGVVIKGCDCIRRNGLQDNCRRSSCNRSKPVLEKRKPPSFKGSETVPMKIDFKEPAPMNFYQLPPMPNCGPFMNAVQQQNIAQPGLIPPSQMDPYMMMNMPLSTYLPNGEVIY